MSDNTEEKIEVKKLKDTIGFLENDIEELEDKVSVLEEQCAKFERFMEPCAIGAEQLWKVVFEDILKQPVPNGENLRDYI